MDGEFPVNSGNVAPPASSLALPFGPLPSQSTLGGLATHASSAAIANNLASGPGMRRRKEPSRQIPILKLERILGLTTASSNILATAESQDLIAYAAGAVVVLYNHRRNKQVGFLYPPAIPPSAANANTSAHAHTGSGSGGNPMNNTFITPLGSGAADLLTGATQNVKDNNEKKKKTAASTRAKPISCLAFSPDGNYLAVGEMGHQPRILIWDIKERVLLHECRGHKYGVLSLAFSPNMHYLVSVGFQHDGYLYVWHWRKGIKLAGNKVTSKVNALAFANDGTYFVTVGLRHVKFWYFDSTGRLPKRGNLASRETQVLDGRSGILGALKNSNFVAAACDRTKAETGYFVTDTGILCMFKEGRVIDKWVDLQVQGASSLAVSTAYVICGCANGVIRLFEPETLKYCGVLPKTHPLGIDISSIVSPDMMIQSDKDAYYPDVIAVAYDEKSTRVTAVYSDRSLYLWDIRDLKKIGKYRSFIFHSDCVYGVEPCPVVTDTFESATPKGNMPPHSFATYSADGTVRFWNLDNISYPCPTASVPFRSSPSFSGDVSSSPIASTPYSVISPNNSCSFTSTPRRNIYSRELVKMLFVDSDAQELHKIKRYADFYDYILPDFGIRSLKMSADGKFLATGDRNGNLRVHDMDTWKQEAYREAHDSEILSIDITVPKSEDSPYLLATASRDRFLHIFDVRNKFEHIRNLTDHSSTITAIKFSNDTEKLISCGADKSIVFRNRMRDSDQGHFATCHNYSGRSTVFGMALDKHDTYVAVVTGERKLFVFNIESGKPVRTCKPETIEESTNGTPNENSGGSLSNIDLDPFSGTFAVTSGSDRSIRLFDLTNGACIAKASAHAEWITSVKFVHTSPSTLRVASTCYDGTIFFWKISDAIVTKMKSRGNDAELKANQTVVGGYSARNQDEPLAAAEDKRLATIRGNAMVRYRRESTAASVKPMSNISQMVRQGERRTFSTMSPAEQRYDDLYKRSPLRRNRVDSVVSTATSRQDNDMLSENAGNSPAVPAPPFQNLGKPGLGDKAHPKLPVKRDMGANGQKPVDEKFERLYNGVPTTGTRERTNGQVYYASNNNRYGANDSGRTNPIIGPRRQTPPPHRMNHGLQRKVSRDALNKRDQHQKDSTRPRPKSNDAAFQQKRSSGGATSPPTRRLSASGLSEGRDQGLSDSPRLKKTHRSVENLIELRNKGTQSDEDRQDSDFEGVTGHTRRHDDDGQEAEDEREEDEDDEDDDNFEEEEIIFITSPQEQESIDKSFHVSLQEINEDNGNISSNENSFADDEPKSATVSDDENHHSTTDDGTHGVGDLTGDEDEGSSEENTDENILRAITSREAPRLTSSLSRTASMSTRTTRHTHYSESISGSPSSGRTTPALRELFQKWEKARNRQSITARFLSSVAEKSGVQLRQPLEVVLSRLDGITKSESHIQETNIPATETVYTDTQKHTDGQLSNPKTTGDEQVNINALSNEVEQNVQKHSRNNSNRVSVKLVRDIQQREDSGAALLTSSGMTTLKDVELRKEEHTTQTLFTADATKNYESQESLQEENFNHILSDLDGAVVLLDSVLDAYTLESQKHGEKPIESNPFAMAFHDKLQQIAAKITRTISCHSQPLFIGQNPPTKNIATERSLETLINEQESGVTHSVNVNDARLTVNEQNVDFSADPSTLQLLDKYSTLLLNMVEKKLAFSGQ